MGKVILEQFTGTHTTHLLTLNLTQGHSIRWKQVLEFQQHRCNRESVCVCVEGVMCVHMCVRYVCVRRSM